ncbi:MAG: TAXI family TRAP transporter solute-binding subunit, partial [Alphaproteobacteria bacterium]
AAMLATAVAFTPVARAAGPDADALRTIETERMSTAVGPDLLEVVSFRRMGGAPNPSGDGRIAYYSARLRLTKDHSFGEWGGRNLTTLAAALGAGQRGIGGASREGNRAGDVLGVNGAMQVVERDGRWISRNTTPESTSPADHDGPGSSARRLLVSIEAALGAVPRGTGSPGLAVIEEELGVAWRNIEGRLTRISRGYPIAGGAPGSEYERLAEAIARVTRSRPDLRFAALPSAGSVENLHMLADGRATVALAQSDIAAMAQRGGQHTFADIPALPQLRALASLYPEAVQVIVRAASPAQSVADLAGKRIAVGAEGSGARVTAETVLAAHRLPAETTPRVPLAPDAAAAALAAGQVDALIVVTLVPARAVLRLADAGPIRLLPLAPDAIAAMTAGDGGLLIPFEVAPGAYPWIDAAVATVATPALLVTTSALTEAEAVGVLTAVFRSPGLVAAAGPAALQIRAETARQGVTVPLHSGADRFFRAGGR